MSGLVTWKKWRNGMSRIKKGDLVRMKPTYPEYVEKVGVVITKPKEKPFLLSPQVTSMNVVVDILVEDMVYPDVRVLLLEKIEK